jgi:NTP pyrophosphatase (non-canonical NTP hydrolase)
MNEDYVAGVIAAIGELGNEIVVKHKDKNFLLKLTELIPESKASLREWRCDPAFIPECNSGLAFLAGIIDCSGRLFLCNKGFCIDLYHSGDLLGLECIGGSNYLLTFDFVKEILPFLVLKRYQFMGIYYCIESNDSHEEMGKLLSDDNFSFHLYEFLASRTAVFPKNKWFDYLTVSMAAEAGEVLGKLSKVIRGDKTLEEICSGIALECGDVIWNIANFSRCLGQTYETIHKNNLDKLFSRWMENKIKGDGDYR